MVSKKGVKLAATKEWRGEQQDFLFLAVTKKNSLSTTTTTIFSSSDIYISNDVSSRGISDNSKQTTLDTESK